MEWKIFTKKLNEYIGLNNLKEVYELLEYALKSESPRRNVLQQLKRKYNSIQDTIMMDTLGYDKIAEEESKIANNLSTFIGSLKQGDFLPNPCRLLDDIVYENDDITNPILILTQSNEMKSMKLFFQQLNFKNVETKVYSDTNYDINGYDLIIFDNQDLPLCNPEKMFHTLDESSQILVRNRIKDMEFVKNKSSKFIIHFGEFLFWVGSNRNRVQSANSKFTLHARTKEVIEFINTYRV